MLADGIPADADLTRDVRLAHPVDAMELEALAGARRERLDDHGQRAEMAFELEQIGAILIMYRHVRQGVYRT